MTEHVKVYGVKPRIQYTANGTLKTFEFPFAIFKTSDIDVYFGDVLQEASDYTVSGARHSDGGSVTFESAPTSGTIITIVRNLSIERTSDFQEGSTLRAKVLNDELDYQIACQQQIAENLNRSMVLPPYAVDSGLDLTLPTPSAGKAIIWNSAGTNLENSTIAINALESTIKNYKNQAQSAATTASNKADLATTQAQTATTQAGIAATKAGEATSAANQLNGMRTNCITEIPQDIKVELSSGTLTLKSGSKVYVPNGSETYNCVTVPADKTMSFQSYPSNKRLFFYRTDNNAITAVADYQVSSGSSASPTSANWVWYDTTNNVIKLTTDSGSTWITGLSFPFCICSNVQNTSSKIEQVFNGFGFMGSTLFALPGVKGLIPSGRNTDGSLKNSSWTTSSVILRSFTGNYEISLATEGTVFTSVTLEYNERENMNYSGNTSYFRTNCGSVVISNDKITSLTVKYPFSSADYNDVIKYSDKKLVTGWSMPDYSGAISLATTTDSYTAPKNGYITFTAVGNNNTAKAFVDSSTVFESNSQYAVSNTFPIAKGSVFTRSGGSNILSIIFVPNKGG